MIIGEIAYYIVDLIRRFSAYRFYFVHLCWCSISSSMFILRYYTLWSNTNNSRYYDVKMIDVTPSTIASNHRLLGIFGYFTCWLTQPIRYTIILSINSSFIIPWLEDTLYDRSIHRYSLHFTDYISICTPHFCYLFIW